jgi:ribosomal protein L32
MRIRTTSPLTSVSRAGTRRAADPRVWNFPRITLVSTCPNCSRERLQHGYTRRVLFDLLKTRRKIDAYCIVCNVCWPITEGERREISRQMTARRQ